MMTTHMKYIQRFIKRYDSELFVALDYQQKPCVWRKRFRYDKEAMPEPLGEVLYGRFDPEFVFALTDTWTQTGEVREWGPEVVCQRLREIDYWDNQKIHDERRAENERVDNARKRHFRSEAEAFAKDYRRAFHKDFGSINTSTLEKIDLRRIRDGSREQKLRNG